MFHGPKTPSHLLADLITSAELIGPMPPTLLKDLETAVHRRAVSGEGGFDRLVTVLGEVAHDQDTPRALRIYAEHAARDPEGWLKWRELERAFVPPPAPPKEPDIELSPFVHDGETMHHARKFYFAHVAHNDRLSPEAKAFMRLRISSHAGGPWAYEPYGPVSVYEEVDPHHGRRVVIKTESCENYIQ